MRSASEHLSLGPQHGMAVTEERVRVGDPVVGAGEDPQHGLASAQMRRARTGNRRSRARRRRRRAPRHRPRPRRSRRGRPVSQSPSCSPICRAQRREREDLSARRPPARRRAPRTRHARGTPRACSRASPSARSRSTAPARARRVDQPARAARGEPVEVRRVRDLVRSLPAERVVRAVGEPVQQDDEDRIHRAGGYGTTSRSRHDARHPFVRISPLGSQWGGGWLYRFRGAPRG